MATSVTSTSKNSRTDLLLRRTRLHFPRFEEATVEITPIEKGGSDRKFYRIRSGPDQTLILVKYNRERLENGHYVRIAEFLAEHEIRAPKIYFHDAEEGLIWIEDLGKTDLWAYRNESWSVRRPLYQSALDQAARLHLVDDVAAAKIATSLPAEFDAALYRWEQNYFFENCLGRVFGIDPQKLADLESLPALEAMANDLAARPRVLVHRDFQSQNIIVRDGKAHLIDFQGMRPGLAEYDIASLLHDPYITMTRDECVELLEYYEAARAKIGSPVASDFRQVFRRCAVQRLMQALGAYGFLGLVKGNSTFLEHIDAAVDSLRLVVKETGELQPLLATLAELPLRAL